MGNPFDSSFRVGRLLGIDIHVHVLFALFLGFELVQGAGRPGGLGWTVQWMSVLWISILLHELGHCAGSTWMGGNPKRILMWPLGGLAQSDPPPRPGAHLLTTVAGPAINLLLMLASALWLMALEADWDLIPLNPFRPFGAAWKFDRFSIQTWLLVVFGLNYVAVLFNLLPIFPFDGGRVLQELLWFRIGWRRSLQASQTIGQLGAVGLGICGVSHQNWMLVAIAVFGFLECVRPFQLPNLLDGAGAEATMAAAPPPGTTPADAWLWDRPKAPPPERAGRDPATGPEPAAAMDASVPEQGNANSSPSPKMMVAPPRLESHEDALLGAIRAKAQRVGVDGLTSYERRVLEKAEETRKSEL